jgi:hypothetical protein
VQVTGDPELPMASSASRVTGDALASESGIRSFIQRDLTNGGGTSLRDRAALYTREDALRATPRRGRSKQADSGAPAGAGVGGGGVPVADAHRLPSAAPPELRGKSVVGAEAAVTRDGAWSSGSSLG